MNARITLAITGAFATMLMAPNAHAQCPAVPLSTLNGTWVFSTDGFAINFSAANNDYLRYLGSGGRFTASVGTDRAGTPQGVLTVTQTTAINNSVTRLEVDAGRFQVNDDCTGGTLTFNTGSRPIQFDFFLVNSSEMVMVGSNNGDFVTGTARLAPQSVCPATPATAINGTWIFSVEGFNVSQEVPEFTAAGRLVANGPVLTVTETAGLYGGNVRMQTETGRVSLNDDCSGGYLTFSVGGRPIQFDYFFSSPNRIVLVASSGGDVVIGEARRAGTLQ